MARTKPRVIVSGLARACEARIVCGLKSQQHRSYKAELRQTRKDAADLNRAIRDVEAWKHRKGKSC